MVWFVKELIIYRLVFFKVFIIGKILELELSVIRMVIIYLFFSNSKIFWWIILDFDISVKRMIENYLFYFK